MGRSIGDKTENRERSKSLAITTPGSGKKTTSKTQPMRGRIDGDPGENFIRLKRPGIDPHGFSIKRFLREPEKPNLIILDALEYGKRLLADEESLNPRGQIREG